MSIKVDKVQLLYGTQTEWEQLNPVLMIGEPGFVFTDQPNDQGSLQPVGLKVGDGHTAYNDLPFVVSSLLGEEVEVLIQEARTSLESSQRALQSIPTELETRKQQLEAVVDSRLGSLNASIRDINSRFPEDRNLTIATTEDIEDSSNEIRYIRQIYKSITAGENDSLYRILFDTIEEVANIPYCYIASDGRVIRDLVSNTPGSEFKTFDYLELTNSERYIRLNDQWVYLGLSKRTIDNKMTLLGNTAAKADELDGIVTELRQNVTEFVSSLEVLNTAIGNQTSAQQTANGKLNQLETLYHTLQSNVSNFKSLSSDDVKTLIESYGLLNTTEQKQALNSGITADKLDTINNTLDAVNVQLQKKRDTIIKLYDGISVFGYNSVGNGYQAGQLAYIIVSQGAAVEPLQLPVFIKEVTPQGGIVSLIIPPQVNNLTTNIYYPIKAGDNETATFSFVAASGTSDFTVETLLVRYLKLALEYTSALDTAQEIDTQDYVSDKYRYVDPAYAGISTGSALKPYRSIGDALGLIPTSCKTLIVLPGSYLNDSIQKDITIQGQGQVSLQNLSISANATLENVSAKDIEISSASKSLTIENSTISGNIISTAGGNTITLINSDFSTITVTGTEQSVSTLTLIGCTGKGVALTRANYSHTDTRIASTSTTTSAVSLTDCPTVNFKTGFISSITAVGTTYDLGDVRVKDEIQNSQKILYSSDDSSKKTVKNKIDELRNDLTTVDSNVTTLSNTLTETRNTVNNLVIPDVTGFVTETTLNTKIDGVKSQIHSEQQIKSWIRTTPTRYLRVSAEQIYFDSVDSLNQAASFYYSGEIIEPSNLQHGDLAVVEQDESHYKYQYQINDSTSTWIQIEVLGGSGSFDGQSKIDQPDKILVGGSDAGIIEGRTIATTLGEDDATAIPTTGAVITELEKINNEFGTIGKSISNLEEKTSHIPTDQRIAELAEAEIEQAQQTIKGWAKEVLDTNFDGYIQGSSSSSRILLNSINTENTDIHYVNSIEIEGEVDTSAKIPTLATVQAALADQSMAVDAKIAAAQLPGSEQQIDLSAYATKEKVDMLQGKIPGPLGEEKILKLLAQPSSLGEDPTTYYIDYVDDDVKEESGRLKSDISFPTSAKVTNQITEASDIQLVTSSSEVPIIDSTSKKHLDVLVSNPSGASYYLKPYQLSSGNDRIISNVSSSSSYCGITTEGLRNGSLLVYNSMFATKRNFYKNGVTSPIQYLDGITELNNSKVTIEDPTLSSTVFTVFSMQNSSFVYGASESTEDNPRRALKLTKISNSSIWVKGAVKLTIADHSASQAVSLDNVDIYLQAVNGLAPKLEIEEQYLDKIRIHKLDKDSDNKVEFDIGVGQGSTLVAGNHNYTEARSFREFKQEIINLLFPEGSLYTKEGNVAPSIGDIANTSVRTCWEAFSTFYDQSNTLLYTIWKRIN